MGLIYLFTLFNTEHRGNHNFNFKYGYSPCKKQKYIGAFGEET